MLLAHPHRFIVIGAEMLEHLDDPNPPSARPVLVELAVAEGERRLRRRAAFARGVAAALLVVASAYLVQAVENGRNDGGSPRIAPKVTGPGAVTAEASTGAGSLVTDHQNLTAAEPSTGLVIPTPPGGG